MINKIICVRGFIIDDVHDCDEDCEMQTGLGKGDCYAECLECGGDYIETNEGLRCTECGSNGIEA